MGKIIVIGSQKGGVGKTTTTLNLAYSLKELGKKVLTVDFDSQANLTTCYGVEDTGVLEYTIGHLMMAQIEEEVTESFEDYIQSRDGVDYLPSSIYLSVVDAKLRTEMGAERMLAEVLEPLKSRYDYILIDTCPSLGMLTINALAAADEVIITVNPQLLAMMGLQDFLRIVGKIKKRINPKLEVAGILLTMCESRTTLCKVLTEEVTGSFQGKIKVFDTRIPATVKVGESIYYNMPIAQYKVIKNQLGSGSCWKLSDLYLDWGCIPFDQMPFATSLRQHNPESAELFGSLSADNRKHEFVARYILSNMSTNAVLYTPVKELEEYTDNLDAEITAFNNRLYFKHTNRRIEKFGQNLYIQGAFQNTKKIIDKLKEMSTEGIPEYQEDVSFWLDLIADVDSEEKKNILQNMFDKTKVSLIYGAAGTGKTYLINHIANYMREKSILFLANTNPAVENLRRKVTAIDPQKCEFMTIKKFLMSRYNRTDYDILVMDECSMVSNSDMADIIDKISCEIMILVGDTYQIESITFGNWFSMAKYFVPAYAWNELENDCR